ncbi:MAG: bifunctional hydroxymethylpyrimidine kinase/phosphomethylpyrimidine kinase [Pseudotabrizicola sp.]|nr:bifunctional hydroxymethylpyrimidine kinase/phosphomethylpyrimidine kinase [Pseudotabrizicola sp.]MDP2080213.1 bifunctional hydroxymethylpyrimidine kinase/phosphomethylpyrimidine kinase [Pseudotabrizicola sp.]MDZ7575296.1 bifunctional hydroxymethylpyrimidine kinase/phosphomethylpyrimidine kinase [Pseudotabrizicola sp.]
MRKPDTRRGTGCTLASAIAARLARGDDLATACAEAKHYLNGWW